MNKRTVKRLDLDQLIRLLVGDYPQLQVIYSRFSEKNGESRKIDSVRLTKTLKLIHDRSTMLADFTTIPFGPKR